MCMEVVHKSWVAKGANCASYWSGASQNHICCFVLPRMQEIDPINISILPAGRVLGGQSRAREGHCRTWQRRGRPFVSAVWFPPQWLQSPAVYATPSVTHPQVHCWHLSGPASTCQLPGRWLLTCWLWDSWEPHWNPSKWLPVNQLQTVTP